MAKVKIRTKSKETNFFILPVACSEIWSLKHAARMVLSGCSRNTTKSWQVIPSPILPSLWPPCIQMYKLRLSQCKIKSKLPTRAKLKLLRKNWGRLSLPPLKRSRAPKRRGRMLTRLIKKLRSKWRDISLCFAAVKWKKSKTLRRRTTICSIKQISRRQSTPRLEDHLCLVPLKSVD